MDRDRIIERIRSNSPQKVALPAISIRHDQGDLVQKFTEMAESAGSDVKRINAQSELQGWFEKQRAGGARLFDLTGHSHQEMPQEIKNHAFNDTDVVVVTGTVGVAENGAVWVHEDSLGERKTPFAAGHLALVLDKRHIVANMHEAYARIDLHTTGFGVFIAGPSKTADIEQSLVIGAHGPVKSTVIVY